MAHRISLAYAPEEPRSVAVVKKLIVVVVAAHVVIGALSSYRAYVQVRSVTLASTSGAVLRSGSGVRVGVVSSGRVPIDYRLELVQGARAETLGVGLLWKSDVDGFYDPRPRRDSLAVVLSPTVLARFASGPALLRAIASGRMQWLRVPPPVVRQLAVRIELPSPPAPLPPSR